MRTESAIAAKELKAQLKSRFPNVKFSVKSDNYSGGSSVNVSWNFGPAPSEVKTLSSCRQYGSFDGMTDCYNYTGAGMEVAEDGSIKEVASAKYVFESRNNSTQTPFGLAAMEVIARHYGWKKRESNNYIEWQPETFEGVDQTASNKYYRVMSECSFVSDRVEFVDYRYIGYGVKGFEPFTIIYKDLLSGKVYDAKTGLEVVAE